MTIKLQLSSIANKRDGRNFIIFKEEGRAFTTCQSAREQHQHNHHHHRVRDGPQEGLPVVRIVGRNWAQDERRKQPLSDQR